MAWSVVVTPRAQRDLDAFARYCRAYSEAFWNEQADRIDRMLKTALPSRPLAGTWFFLTGAPYRARLVVVGRRTKFWIVYRIDEAARTIVVLRFWGTARDPASFRI